MAPPLTGSSLIPHPANRRVGFHETHPLFAACRRSAVRQRPRGCAEVEERQGDPRLPARADERSRQEHQGRARRIRPGRLLAWSHACQIRLHLRDRARGGDPQSGQRRTGDDLQGRTELLRAARRPPRRERQCQQDGAGQAPRGVRRGHERDGTDNPTRELRLDASYSSSETIPMKAIVVTDQAAGTAGMKLVEQPEPRAAINDVVVQVHASGFVPTEMAWPSTWTDRRDRDRTPSIPGHELAGVVTALGYGTTG